MASGSGTDSVPNQPEEHERLMREHPEEMLTLRAMLGWRIWELYRSKLDQCAEKDTFVCWYRLDVGLLSSAQGDAEVQTSGGRVLRCAPSTYEKTTAASETARRMSVCVASAIGVVDNVYLPETSAGALSWYQGVIDVDLEITRRKLAPAENDP